MQAKAKGADPLRFQCPPLVVDCGERGGRLPKSGWGSASLEEVAARWPSHGPRAVSGCWCGSPRLRGSGRSRSAPWSRRELGGRLQRARPGRVCDRRCVLRVRFCLARIRSGGPSYREPGRPGNLAARVTGHGQGKGVDRGGLGHDHQRGAEPGFEVVEDDPSLECAVGHRLVEDLLSGRGRGRSEPSYRRPSRERRPRLRCRTAHLLREVDLARCPQAARRCAGPGGGRVSHLPGRPGGITPQAIRSMEGARSCRVWRPAAPLQDRE
ncbi:hypothetical protein EES41_31135 [Streptomyces sp. ADI95-16]|nr:hypothetical protein EES41_31135 [Streptomyces sp. ADI95-16]